MRSLIRQLLAAPVFEGDDDKTRVAGLFNTLLLASLATSLLTGMVAPLAFAQPWIGVGVAGLVFLLSLVSMILMRLGAVPAASVLYLTGMWVAFSVLMVLSEGVNSPFITAYVTLTVEAGLLLGGWAAVVVAEVSVLAGLAMFYAGTTDVLPAPVLYMAPGPSWITLTANLIATVAVLYLATRAMNEALQRARTSAAALDEQRELLEQTVAERTRDLEQRAVQLATAADVGRAAASLLNLESLSHADLRFAGIGAENETYFKSGRQLTSRGPTSHRWRGEVTWPPGRRTSWGSESSAGCCVPR